MCKEFIIDLSFRKTIGIRIDIFMKSKKKGMCDTYL